VSEPEDGKHVRDGYTLETYACLFRKTGFTIVTNVGLGTPLLVALDRCVRSLRNSFGDGVALPLFLLVLPLSWLDTPDPKVPFSLYVKAVRSPPNGQPMSTGTVCQRDGSDGAPHRLLS
jgi:hypothetical protein